MKYGPREEKRTISQAVIQTALEKYLREIQVLYDNEEVQISLSAPIVATLVIRKENEIEEVNYTANYENT